MTEWNLYVVFIQKNFPDNKGEILAASQSRLYWAWVASIFLSRALFFTSNAMISIYNSCKRLHLSINRFSDVSIVSMTKNEYCLAVQFL